MDYTKKMESELANLKGSNQDYFKEMVIYAGLKTFFVDDQVLSETLYNMVCDLKQAEEEGLSAEDYFGKNPQAMMDQILSETPRRSWRSVWTIIAVIAVFIAALGFMVDFIWLNPFELRWLAYASDILLCLIALPMAFSIWSKTIYQGLGRTRALMTIMVLYGLLRTVFRYLRREYGDWGALALPPAWQIGLAFLVVAVIVCVTYKDRYGRGIASTFIGLFLAGIYKYLTFLPQHPSIPFVILVLGIVLGIAIAKKGKQ